MDKEIIGDLQQLLNEIADRIVKAKKLIKSASSPGSSLDSSVQVLVDVDNAGGVVTKEEWLAIGKKHEMDARGLGGFFVGDGSMICIAGDKRALTERGMKLVKRWKERSEKGSQ